MLNRFYFISLGLLTVLLVFALSSKLVLTFFILYPFFLFPYFFPTQDRSPKLDRIFLVFAGLSYIGFLIFHFSIEMIVLGILQASFAFIMILYRRHWIFQLRDAIDQKEIILRDLETFNKKFDSRMSSLQHLEKQVAGLLDLFEIAKDFGEYLSYQGITDILSKRVKPLFPFKSLTLLLVNLKPDAKEKFYRYSIDDSGVKLVEDPLLPMEQEALEKLKTNKSVMHLESRWIFPLLFDESLQSLLIVENGLPDDLAKYEVLSAFLTLQVSKIHLYESVHELAIRDSLTHVFVRRHFMERFEEELKRSLKFSIPLAVLMLDIDHFKRYNDDYGHIAGDSTLQQVADLLVQSLRKVDIVGRYGGEEFVVVIPETKQEGALEICERIRSSIARHTFTLYNTETRVTVSLGLVGYIPDPASQRPENDFSKLAFELMQKADKALYQAKEEGRNQVVLYQAG